MSFIRSIGACIIALDSGGSKANIRLSERGRPCLEGEFSRLFNPVDLFDNKKPDNLIISIWKRGHGRH